MISKHNNHIIAVVDIGNDVVENWIDPQMSGGMRIRKRRPMSHCHLDL